MLSSILVFVFGEDRVKRWAGRLMVWGMQKSTTAMENPVVRDMLCREGMAHSLQRATALNTWTAEEWEKYRREMNTPEALELEERMTKTYAGARVECVRVQELPDGSSSFTVVTDRGMLAFQAPILQFSDSSQEVPHAS